MECKACGGSIPEGSAAAIAQAMEGFWEWYLWYSHAIDHPRWVDGLADKVVKVAEKTDYSDDQGSSTDIFMVFRIGDRHFKKSGYADSYGTKHWDGPFIEIQPKTKTVTYYE